MNELLNADLHPMILPHIDVAFVVDGKEYCTCGRPYQPLEEILEEIVTDFETDEVLVVEASYNPGDYDMNLN